jgi:MFS family permease
MPTPPPSPSLPLQRRTMQVLVVAQLLGALGLAAGGTAGALLAEDLTGTRASVGLPLAVLVLGSGIGAVAITRIMDHAGRRTGLTVAHLGGALGAALAVAAAALRDWPLLLAGCALLGGGNAAVMLARYAAADLAARRGRSISTVVAAASVGAVVGPNLLGPAGTVARTLGLPDPAGLFLLALPAFLAAALVLVVFLRPDPLQVARASALAASTATDSRRPASTPGKASLAAVLGDRQIRLAVLVLALTNLAMVGVMAVAPVHLHAHGAGMGVVGLMVSAHIAAMYAPSPLTGWLADAFGGRVVAGVGALLLVGAGALAAVVGSRREGIMAALLLLGIGWNAGLIGGSALLRDAPVQPSLRTRAEGIGELGMGAAAAMGGSGAGLVLATGGFSLLGAAAAAPCLLVLAAVAGGHRRRGGGLGGVPWPDSASAGIPPALKQGGSR